MRQPVWLVKSLYKGELDEEFWAFVAAPDRDAASPFGDYSLEVKPTVIVLPVTGEGRLTSGGTQATIEADEPRLLTDDELRAVDWCLCDLCGQYRRASLADQHVCAVE